MNELRKTEDDSQTAWNVPLKEEVTAVIVGLLADGITCLKGEATGADFNDVFTFQNIKQLVFIVVR